MKRSGNMIPAFLGIMALIVFFQNTEPMALHFLFWKLTLSRIILLPLIMLLGVALGYFLAKR